MFGGQDWPWVCYGEYISTASRFGVVIRSWHVPYHCTNPKMGNAHTWYHKIIPLQNYQRLPVPAGKVAIVQLLIMYHNYSHKLRPKRFYFRTSHPVIFLPFLVFQYPLLTLSNLVWSYQRTTNPPSFVLSEVAEMTGLPLLTFCSPFIAGKMFVLHCMPRNLVRQ